MTLEESRKRMEASLARKRINIGLANGTNSGSDTPNSPATNGAMDSLLEKLRAAAPQAKDQRERRRRARLKERHQVRVASGQKIPDNMMSEADGGNENEEGHSNDLENGDDDANPSEPGQTGVPNPGSESANANKDSQVSEGEDVADRAASMLQGLRNNTEGNGERLRRRRESADEERRNRRLRRRHGTGSGSKDSTEGSALPSLTEPSPPVTDSVEPDDEAAANQEKDEEHAASPGTPSIVVSPTTEHHDLSPEESQSTEDIPPAKPTSESSD